MTYKEYNGWTNYETWCANLWMDNEEGTQRYWQERAEEIVKENDGDKESAASDLAREIEEQHYESKPEVSGVWGDFLNAAMSEVNWHEIAEHYIGEVEIESENEESEESNA